MILYHIIIWRFIMANGALVRVLIHTSVTKYLNSKAVDGSFVYNKRKVHILSFTEAFSSNSLSIGYFHSKYGLQDNTIDFIGHALALHRDDSYLDEPAIDTIKKMKVTPLLPCTLILDHDGLLRISIFGFIGTLSRRFSLYISTLWFGRASSVSQFKSSFVLTFSFVGFMAQEPDLTVDLGAASAATEDA
ncbi:hypothetical protein BHM03_00002636 [Ensete ventricosum]|nr:hypothetical protein BHM03_00002636 [Ensete ventricosum]